jgi:hypothetical protein
MKGGMEEERGNRASERTRQTPMFGEQIGCRTGGVNPHGLRVGYRRVRVRVDILLPLQNPYPIRGYGGYWSILASMGLSD